MIILTMKMLEKIQIYTEIKLCGRMNEMYEDAVEVLRINVNQIPLLLAVNRSE